MVVDEANNRFAPLWKLDNEKHDILKQYCEYMDVLSKDFNGISFDVEIDEIQMNIKIILECPDIIIEQPTHYFYEVTKRTVKFGFSVSEDGNLNISFVFPSIWERV
jgi:hypothetical protein